MAGSVYDWNILNQGKQVSDQLPNSTSHRTNVYISTLAYIPSELDIMAKGKRSGDPEAFEPCKELETFMVIDEKAKRGETGSDTDSSVSSTLSDSLRKACHSHFVLLILTFANILNYMDRYTIGGVLKDIIDYYEIQNAEAGLLQTSFIVSYMVLSPIFGYLGDRYNRKVIMSVGIFFWSLVTLAGSFIGKSYFWAFLLLRGLVGIGEASYSTIAPTIIADLFVKDQRTVALAIFYFAIPVGSGLGYIVGSNVASAIGGWQWSLRVTPPLGLLCVILILFCVKEPPRGASEGGSHLTTTSWSHDMLYLCKNKSFVLSTLGFTCVAFVAGAMALWAPLFLQYAIMIQGHFEQEKTVALIFGVITVIAGFLGVGLGSLSARMLSRKFKNADPYVCAFGLIVAGPFFFLALICSKYSIIGSWLLVFFGEVALCLNWAIVTDILLYVVIPTRRSTAEAFQILLSHALGDAGSPYLVGQISDALKPTFAHTGPSASNFFSLGYSLFIPCFICVIGGGFFLVTGIFINADREKADNVIRAGRERQRLGQHEASQATMTTIATQDGDQDSPLSSDPCLA